MMDFDKSFTSRAVLCSEVKSADFTSRAVVFDTCSPVSGAPDILVRFDSLESSLRKPRDVHQ